jgi:O-antigen ligase
MRYLTDPARPRAARAALPGHSLAHHGFGYDATSALTVYIFLLFAIPSRLIFGPLGAAGTPAQVFAVALLAWFAVNRIVSGRGTSFTSSPVIRALLVFGATVLISYIVATTRPIDGVELRSADRGLISLAAWLGVALVTAYRIQHPDRLVILLRRLVAAGEAIAMLGIAQFFTGLQFINRVEIPGLSLNAVISEGGRNGFNRPAGTATHPIEFGVVLSMVLPIALHYALEDKERNLLQRWLPVAAIAFAIPLSISRSAILGCAIVLGLLLPTWPRRRRRGAYVALALLIASVYVVVPGLLGTFRNLILGIAQDNSALSRTGSYQLAGEFVKRAPLFGRGFATFLPSYRILDNQYLGLLIETGLVGLIALLSLLITAFAQARRVRRKSSDPSTRSLAQALAASTAAGAASLATFDTFGFPMAIGTLIVVIGSIGAMRRLSASLPSEYGHARETLPLATSFATDR